MNTKKAHEARAPLGRCLKSTKFYPDVRNEEKKTLFSQNSDEESYQIDIFRYFYKIICQSYIP